MGADLESAAFKVGVARGMWQLVEAQFPFYVFAVTEDGSEGQDKEHFFRFELNGFPAVAPWAQIWDFAGSVELPLPQRPQRNTLQRESFKTWQQPAVYRPWDRFAGAHFDWNTKYPDLPWNPSRNLSFVLNDLHQILNRGDS
jgi:hypothetical protein